MLHFKYRRTPKSNPRLSQTIDKWSGKEGIIIKFDSARVECVR